MDQRFTRFVDFYPFYLGEHRNRACRRLHFLGTSFGLGLFIVALVTHNAWWIAVALLVGYAFAWAGHLFFERNRPATFRYPFYSFIGDWVMWSQMLRGRIPI